MKRTTFITSFLLLIGTSFAQNINQQLAKAWQQFENDEQLRHATASLYVINAKTGEVVFEKNAQVGLAPASTQKIITSITAFELLGKDYRYQTQFGILENNNRKSLYIIPSGDPTLGSWRWESTKEKNVMQRIVKAIQATGLNKWDGVLVDAAGWNSERTPDGWIWQDIGNYYGAGAGVLNWRENQYDLVLKSGSNVGDSVSVVETDPVLYSGKVVSMVTTAAKGSGDNAYIYNPAMSSIVMVRGTIPVNENRFVISGAMTNPADQFIETIVDSLKGKIRKTSYMPSAYVFGSVKTKMPVFHTEYSPTLDSIIYWFNKKSINLYGEALVKTMAYVKKGVGSTDTGVNIVREFWKERGMDEEELNICDGSGLSPLNRVTTHAQVEILKYAKSRDWFPYFYTALPEYNGMKMKSGTIRDVKGFCGYQRSKDGTEYIFSILVNNYNGYASAVVNKMYKVLDLLK